MNRFILYRSKVKFFIIFNIILLNASFTFSQDFQNEWHSIFDSSKESFGDAITVDNENNIITAGYFRDTIIILGDTIISDNDLCSYFIIKYDIQGNVLWDTKIECSFLKVYSLTTDNADNLYLSGFFDGEWQLPDTFISTLGYTDGFLLSYDKDGNFRWVNSSGSSGIDYQWDVTSDGVDGIYVMGSNSIAPFYTNSNIILYNVGAYIIKYDKYGNVIWGYNYGGDESSIPGDVYADNNEVIAIGSSIGNLLIDTTLKSNNRTIALVSFDLDGHYKRAQLIGIGDESTATGISVTKDDEENVYLYGGFYGNLNIQDTTLIAFGSNENNFLLKIDNNWRIKWIEHFQSESFIYCKKLKYINNRIFLILKIYGENSFEIFETTFLPKYNDDNYIIDIFKDGKIDQIIHCFGSWEPEIRDIALSQNNTNLNLFFTGVFGTEISFPYLNLTSENNYNYFLNKYSLDLNTTEFNDNFLIFPNPTNGIFNIKYLIINPQHIHLQIYDIKGTVLYTNSFDVNEIGIIDGINISNFSNGLYILKIQFDENTIYKRIIISKY